MFIINFEDGSSLTEAQVGRWDDVPRDRRIAFIGIVVSSVDNQLLILRPLPVSCDKYCCTKLGRMVPGKDNGRQVGYVLYGVRHNMLYRIAFTIQEGLGPMWIVPYENNMIAEGAWRNGS